VAEKPNLPAGPADTPTASSLFVLFEGPWIFDQPDTTSPNLRATTFGHLDAAWSASHHCPVGLGTPGSSNLNNIPDSSNSQLALPLELSPGERWSIAAVPGYSPTKKLLTDVFDPPYKNDTFVYIKKSKMTVSPHDDDRVVTLPMPDAAYIGAYLEAVTVTSAYLANGGTPTSNPYFAVILEYQNIVTPPALTLSPSGRTPIGLTAGKHLVFRMIHGDNMTPGQHVRAAHETLRRRIGSWDPHTGDGTELDLTTQFSGDGTKDFKVTPGKNTAGFYAAEMGIGPMEQGKGGTGYGDCCGGGCVLGG
jgi:hypothetical protein